MRKWLNFILILFLFCSCFSRSEGALMVGEKSQDVFTMKQRLQELGYIGKGKLTKTFTENTMFSLKEFQKNNGLEETGILDEATEKALFSDDAVRKPHPTLMPLATPSPLPDETGWPKRDSQGFLSSGMEFFMEDDESGRWIYLGRDLQISIVRMKDASIPLVWFETDIIFRNKESFRTIQTDPEHPGKKFQYPYIISREAQFVLGFSDDFFANRMADGETVGIIIRDGEIISANTNRKTGHHLPNLDMMALFPDNSAEVYECSEITAEELLKKGAVNVFSFGPILLRNGEINEMVYTYYRSIEPRHALGMIEPGHFLLLSFQGRTSESKGTTLQRVAETMKQRGVQEALNLDGGNTMALIFRGRMLNKLATYKRKQFVRTVTSLIGIGTTMDQAE